MMYCHTKSWLVLLFMFSMKCQMTLTDDLSLRYEANEKSQHQVISNTQHNSLRDIGDHGMERASKASSLDHPTIENAETNREKKKNKNQYSSVKLGESEQVKVAGRFEGIGSRRQHMEADEAGKRFEGIGSRRRHMEAEETGKEDVNRVSTDPGRTMRQEVVADVEILGGENGNEEPWEGETPESVGGGEKSQGDEGKLSLINEPEPELFEREAINQPIRKNLESVSSHKDGVRDLSALESTKDQPRTGNLDGSLRANDRKEKTQNEVPDWSRGVSLDERKVKHNNMKRAAGQQGEDDDEHKDDGRMGEGEERRNKRKLNAVFESNVEELDVRKNMATDDVVVEKLLQQQQQLQRKDLQKQLQQDLEQEIERRRQQQIGLQQEVQKQQQQQQQQKDSQLGQDQQQRFEHGLQDDISMDRIKNLKQGVADSIPDEPEQQWQQLLNQEQLRQQQKHQSQLNQQQQQEQQQQDLKNEQKKQDTMVDGFERVTMSEYDREILPQSHYHPFLFFAYTDFCEECRQAEVVWESFQSELGNIGLRGAALNIQLDSTLARRLRVWGVPTVVVVMSGRVQAWHTKLPFSIEGLRQFLLDVLLSTECVTEVTDMKADEFLGGWADNRVRLLLSGPGNVTSSHLLLASTAFTYRERVATGFINTSLKDGRVSRLSSLYKLSPVNYSMLIFNEQHSLGPVVRHTMHKLNLQPIRELLDDNLYLLLPRASNQATFDYLCPVEPSISNKRLCVLLLTRKDPAYSGYLAGFRRYAMDHRRSDGRVRYSYVYEETQPHFISSLTFKQGATNTTSNTLKVAVIWRRKSRLLQYDLLTDGWMDDSFSLVPAGSSHSAVLTNSMAQRCSRRLTRTVDWLLETYDVLPYVMSMKHNLTDEHARSLPVRIVLRLRNWADRILDRMLSIERGTYLTVFSSAVLIGALGLAMHTMAVSEHAKIKSKCKERQIWSKPVEADSKSCKQAIDGPISDDTVGGEAEGGYDRLTDNRPTVRIHPLSAESFDALILKSEPGVRLILLLVDSATKDRLLQYFAQAMLPYCRSKAFQFSFLQLDDDDDGGEGGRNQSHLDWYRRLLEESVNTAAHAAVAAANAGPLAAIAARSTGGNAILRRRGFCSTAAVSAAAEVRKDLAHINAKNCVGTVLAINGPRRYYAMYHVSSTMATVAKDNDEEEEEMDGDARKLFDCELLRGLPKWMETLCEASMSKGASVGGLAPGGLKKFRVNNWPMLTVDRSWSSKLGVQKKQS